jgi:hypothetical protein
VLDITIKTKHNFFVATTTLLSYILNKNYVTKCIYVLKTCYPKIRQYPKFDSDCVAPISGFRTFTMHAGLVLRDFFLRDFASPRLENLRNFSNSRNNFRFRTIWHKRSLAALVLCWRLAVSDVTVKPTVTCVDWLGWWYNHENDTVLPSTALVFVTKMSDKRKST